MVSGEPLTPAARAEGIDPRTAKRILSDSGAIRMSKGGGRYRLTGHDRLLRPLPVLVKGESQTRTVILSRHDAKLVGAWLEATGSPEKLTKLGPITVTNQATGRKITLESNYAKVEAASAKPGALRDWQQRGGGYGTRSRAEVKRLDEALEDEDLDELTAEELDELAAELEAENPEIES